jgi:hypothetical protein
MATKGREHREKAWRNAKKICQLNARQVGMARALGMNPNKLPSLPKPGSCKILTPRRDADAPKRITDVVWQVENLVCYLMNLADDLQAWLAQGMAPPEVLARVPRELREIAEALETGVPVSPIPAIPGPPCQPRHAPSRQEDRERKSDDEIPF